MLVFLFLFLAVLLLLLLLLLVGRAGIAIFISAISILFRLERFSLVFRCRSRGSRTTHAVLGADREDSQNKKSIRTGQLKQAIMQYCTDTFFFSPSWSQ